MAELVELDALDTAGGKEELTPLGAHLSVLPVDANAAVGTAASGVQEVVVRVTFVRSLSAHNRCR